MRQTKFDVPLPTEGVTSPFEPMLVAAGWSPDNNDECPEEAEADLFSEFDSKSLSPTLIVSSGNTANL